MPAIVREADDRGSLEFAIVENLQRAGLDPLEEAMGFQHLIDEYGFTQERVAERIGRSRPAVANALRLLSLNDTIKAKIRSGALSASHARALLSLREEQRDQIAQRIEHHGMTVRDIERLGERRHKPAATLRSASKSADVEAVEERLRFALGTHVAVVPGTRGGRLEIRYVDSADLTRIIDAIIS